MLILCDFDGTITEVDVTDLLWSGCVSPTERERMVAEVNCGNWSMHQYIAHGYGFVREQPSHIVADLRERVRLRNGWSEFVHSLDPTSDPLCIVSNGLGFYIREFVPAAIPIMSFEARFNGRYHVELPKGCVLLPGEEFKVNRARQLMADSGQRHVVYIGDGRADFAPSMFCDTVFAVRGSQLAHLRENYSLPTFEFDTFDTITQFVLSASSQRLHQPAPVREIDDVLNWDY